MSEEPGPPPGFPFSPKRPDREAALDRAEAMFLRTEIVNFSMMGLWAWTQLQRKIAESAPGRPIQVIGTPMVTKRIIVWSGTKGGLSSNEPETLALFDYVSEVWGHILTILVAAGSVSWALSLDAEPNKPPSHLAEIGTKTDRPTRLELLTPDEIG